MKVLALVLVLVGICQANPLAESLKNQVGGALPNGGKIYAVLLAGSKDWENYADQAGVCHLYHVLSDHGIPDEQIIVLNYDDIAQNSANPTPGIIIHELDGPDVYAGVLKDYVGDVITPQNFLNIIQGKQIEGGSGKVLQSGPQDHVLIYMGDHGGPGVFYFPGFVELYADDLANAIKNMHANNMFEKMTIYVDACYSGSLFVDLLPTDINVYAVTSAPPDADAYFCYYDETRETYVGNCFDTQWLRDVAQSNLSTETLQKQFDWIKTETAKVADEKCHQYGDLSIAALPVAEFQQQSEPKKSSHSFASKAKATPISKSEGPLYILERKLAAAQTEEEKATINRQLLTLLRNRDFLRSKVESIARRSLNTKGSVSHLFANTDRINNFQEYKDVVSYFSKNCFSLTQNPYTNVYLGVFNNLLKSGSRPETIKKAMDSVCTHPTIIGIK